MSTRGKKLTVRLTEEDLALVDHFLAKHSACLGKSKMKAKDRKAARLECEQAAIQVAHLIGSHRLQQFSSDVQRKQFERLQIPLAY
jgi:hypothetical protein